MIKMNDEQDYEYTIDVWDDLAKDELLRDKWKNSLISDYDEDSPEVDEIRNRLSAIEKRLSILVPDRKLLKKYELLKDLYDQYKAAEALLDGPDPESVS